MPADTGSKDDPTQSKDLLPVTVENVIEFSRSLLATRTPSWQRLQGVSAVEAYRDLVLRASEPSLIEVKTTLRVLAAKERAGVSFGDRTESQGEDVRGVIDPNEPLAVQQMRRELRVRYRLSERLRVFLLTWLLSRGEGSLFPQLTGTQYR